MFSSLFYSNLLLPLSLFDFIFLVIPHFESTAIAKIRISQP